MIKKIIRICWLLALSLSQKSKAIFTVFFCLLTIAVSNQALAQSGTWSTKAPMTIGRYYPGAESDLSVTG